MSNARLLDNIQVVRGLAAFMVVVGHSAEQFGNHPIAGMGRIRVPAVGILGYGVDLFFIVSGFIMVYVTSGKSSDEARPGEFFKRRLLRVVPLYWLFTLLMIIAALSSPGSVNNGFGSAWHVIASFLFIPAARPDGLMHPVLGLGWTLNYEFFFYSCFALSLVLPGRWRDVAVSAVFVVLALCNPALPAGPLAFWSDPIILEFVLGMIVARVFLSGRRLEWRAAAAIIALGIVLLYVLTPMFPGVHRLFVAGLPCVLIVGGFALAPQRDWHGAVMAIGNASYALYLCHPFALNAITKLWEKLHLPPWSALYLATLIAGALVAGVIVHRFAERPIDRAIKRMRRRPGAKTTASAGA